MNIFVLNEDERLSAQSCIDRHVVKMPTESVQLLCSSHHFYSKRDDLPSFLMEINNLNHPCSIWCREHINNYNWLLSYTRELCQEYTFRYKKTHKSSLLLDWLTENKPRIVERDVKLIDFGNHQITAHAQTIPEQYRQVNTIEAYRNTYLKTKVYDKNGKVMMIYTDRQPPKFLLDKLNFNLVKNKYKVAV